MTDRHAPHTAAAIDAITAAIDAEHDFGGWLSLVLVYAAARKGTLDALTAGRPGSWEAALVDQLARGLAFDDDGLRHYADSDADRREDVPHERDEAVKLLEDALFLRANGERPPGAPAGDLEAETWRQWDRKAEVFLRSLLGQAGDQAPGARPVE